MGVTGATGATGVTGSRGVTGVTGATGTISGSYLNAYREYTGGGGTTITIGNPIPYNSGAPNPIIGGSDITMNGAGTVITFVNSGTYLITHGIASSSDTEIVPMINGSVVLDRGSLGVRGNRNLQSISYIYVAIGGDTLSHVVTFSNARVRADNPTTVDGFVTIIRLD